MFESVLQAKEDSGRVLHECYASCSEVSVLSGTGTVGQCLAGGERDLDRSSSGRSVAESERRRPRPKSATRPR